MTVNPITKVASIVTAVGILSGTIVWAADTRYVTIAAQQKSEVRQLKRDIKRLELKVENDTASAEDAAFLEFLKRDVEELSE